MSIKDYHGWHMDKPKFIRKDKRKATIPASEKNDDVRNAFLEKCREIRREIGAEPLGDGQT